MPVGNSHHAFFSPFFSARSLQIVRSKKHLLAEQLSFQSHLALLQGNGQEESKVRNGKSRTPCLMNSASRRMG